MRYFGATLLALVLAGPAEAARDYQGREFEALVCVYLFNTTAELLARDGQITAERRDNIFHWSSVVLTKYVGGTEGDRQAALTDVASGRDRGAAVAEFEARGRACLAQFPL